MEQCQFFTIWRFVEDKIEEGWIVYDQLDFLKQLGIVLA